MEILKKIHYSLILMSISLCTFATEPVQDAALKAPEVLPYNPLIQAKIRLYGQNGQKIYMQHSFDCAGKKKGIRDYVSNTGGVDAFKTFARLTFNRSEGMPETAIQKIAVSNEFKTYLYVSFKEFLVAANEPINLHGFVMMAQNANRTKADITDQCQNTMISFKPKAGHEYEVLGQHEQGQCQFKIYDLKTNQLVTYDNQAYVCPKK